MKQETFSQIAQPVSVETTKVVPASAVRAGISRGVALFLGIFSLINLVIELRHPKFDANFWWIDLYPLPKIAPLVAQAVLLFLAIVWLAYALAVLGQGLHLVFLSLVRTRQVEINIKAKGDDGIASGIRFVWGTKIILGTITLDLFAVLLGGATYMLPAFALKVLHVGPVGFGWLRAAPSLGAILMAFLQAHLPPMKHAGRMLLWAVIAFGLATIGFGLSKSFALSMAMLFLTGAFDNISVVIRHTLVQVLTPDEMRGRVSAVNNVFIGASNDLGGWESGLTAEWLGLGPSVVAGGIGTLVVVGLVAIIWPQVRRFGSLHDAAMRHEH